MSAQDAGAGIESLPRSANRWVPSRQKDENLSAVDLALKKIRGILNRLTVDNNEKLVQQLLDVGLNNKEILQGLVILLFDKACDEPHFSSLYAVVCKELTDKAPNFDPQDNKSGPTFRRLLVKKCQEEFFMRKSLFEEFDEKAAMGTMTPDDEERRLVQKFKMLGNIKFIGELGKRQMISERILHECIKQLLGKVHDAEEEDVECLCKMFETAGQQLDHTAAATHMNKYFERMQELADDRTLPARIRFMLQDVIDLRANKWVPRRDNNKMQTIGEIRKEAGMDPTKPLGNSKRTASPLFGGPAQGGLFGPPQRGPYPFQGGPRGGGAYGGMAGFNPRYGMQQQFRPNMPPGPQGGPSMGMGNFRMGSRDNLGPMGGMRNAPNAQQQGGPGQFGPGMGGRPRPGYSQSYDNFGERGYGSGGNAGATPKPQMDELERLKSMQQEVKLLKSGSTDLGLRPQTGAAAPRKGLPPSAISPSGMPSATSPTLLGETLSGRSFTPPVAPKIKKRPKSKEELDRSTKSMLEEYLNAKEVAEAVRCVRELDSPDYHSTLVSLCITHTLDSSKDADRSAVADLLVALHAEEVITDEEFLSGFKSVLDGLEDLRLDIPKIDQYVGTYAARALRANLIDLKTLFGYFTATPGTYLTTCVEFLSAYTRLEADQLAKGEEVTVPAAEGEEGTTKMETRPALGGEEAAAEASRRTKALVDTSGVNLTLLLPPAQRTESALFDILCKANLDFLMPLLQLENSLVSEMKDRTVPELMQWLDTHVGADKGLPNDVKLVMTIVQACLEHICARTTFVEDLDPKEKGKRELVMFKEYKPLLTKYVTDDGRRQLACVYAVQVFCNKHDFPKGFMQRCFMCLYQLDVCEDVAFLVWKEDVNDQYPGKGRALFQVNQWLNWLEESEDEDEE